MTTISRKENRILLTLKGRNNIAQRFNADVKVQ